MKTRNIALLALAGLLGLPAGCKDAGSDGKNAAQKGEKSTGRLVIDGFTGRQAVESGKKARKTIEAVSRKKGQDLDDVFGK
ncbi:MAG: hypothetical protein HQ559_16290 [Lentisphaerae bacterium]|nr:hypothetical protein [Lentisphaerota bacterium]